MTEAKNETPSDKAWGSKAPWPFFLLFMITGLFCIAGVALDSLADDSSIRIQKLITGNSLLEPRDKPLSYVKLEKEEREMLIELEKERSQRLGNSAKIMYDFAKVSLGGLLTCITQMISYILHRQQK